MSIMTAKTAFGALCVAALLGACAPSQPEASATPSASPGATATATPSRGPSMLPGGIVFETGPASTPPSPSPTPAAVAPGAGARYSATALPPATPQPVVSPSATPLPTPTPTPTPVVPENAPPKIYRIMMSSTEVHSGDTVSGYILTSLNAASVELRIAGYSLVMPKTAPGHFDLSYKVPAIPFFLHRTYPMTVIARNTAGDATTTSIPITVR